MCHLWHHATVNWKRGQGMPDRLRTIAHEATRGINELLGGRLSEEESVKVDRLIEDAVIKALLEGQHRAVDAALQYPEADQDMAHKIATAIRQKNDLLIANLTSLR
jgi:hypothetical protein